MKEQDLSRLLENAAELMEQLAEQSSAAFQQIAEAVREFAETNNEVLMQALSELRKQVDWDDFMRRIEELNKTIERAKEEAERRAQSKRDSLPTPLPTIKCLFSPPEAPFRPLARSPPVL